MKAARWTTEQLQDYQQRKAGTAAKAAPAKGSKYRNTKVEQDGQTFDSKKEAQRWKVLRALEQAGEIRNLVRQVTFSLQPAVELEGEKRKKPALRYVADFIYVAAAGLVVEDVKSDATRKLASYRTKKHLMKSILNLEISEA